MKTVVLNNGVKMPILGLGTYQITDPAQCEAVVLDALEAGYRLIDTAAAYGNEEAIGRALKASGIPREELFITTKLWIASSGYQPALQAFERSMEKLGLDYLDLYLMHWPFGDMHGSWRAMTELQRAGRIRAIGVCNFEPDRLAELIAFADVVPALNQIESNPFHQRVNEQHYLQQQGVQMQSWASFAEGRGDLFTNPVLTAIATRHHKSVAQVVLRWLIQRQIVVIPKTVSPERLRANIAVFDFELSAEETQQISQLETASSQFFDMRDPEKVAWLCSWKLDI